ncbi:hypothetical protein NSQ43_10410 [Sporosarcina sp. FSL W8-0480]|uniref:hypothetical protein n=1 Tax=Sporosarcina sp. FSL W8-0480 TaxID=2954701 RepID=UPI0030DD65C7
MANNQWNDDNLDKLLHSMPKIKDGRPSSEILERLKNDNRLKEDRRPKVKKWIPSIVAVAALLLLSLLLPSMLKGNQDMVSEPMMDNARSANKESITMDNKAEKASVEEDSDSESFETTTFSSMDIMGMRSHVVLAKENDNTFSLNLGLIHEANVVPVTILIDKDRVQTDLEIDHPDSVALYKEYAGLFDEESYGFDNYHPYKGELTTTGKTVIHKLPENHGYDMAVAILNSYTDSTKETFTDFDEFKVVDEGGNPLVFDYVGEAMEFSLKRQLPYFKYVMPSGETYLVPYENGDSSTVTQALLSMKKADNDIVKEVIPTGIDYQVTESHGVAVVTFDSPLDFTTIPEHDVLQMIEGFMLTASNYDVQVQLKNIEQSHFENYDLTKPLPKPIGANPIWLP